MADFPLKRSDIALCFYERKLVSLKKRGYKLFQLLVFFFVLSVTRPKPPLGQIVNMTLNNGADDVYSP